MPRLVVILPLEPMAVGDGYPLSTWPLHLTVAPTFVIDVDLARVIAAVAAALRPEPALTLTAGPDAGFGRSMNLPVSLIEPNPQLQAVHLALVDTLEQLGATFDDPDFTRDGYGPHVTMTRLDRVRPGDRLDLRQAAIVDMQPVGDDRNRYVVWTHSLAG